jgi:hypothetical protein
MRKTSRVYVLTVHPSSRSVFRLWTGKSLHALRHCSRKLINQTLAEMQQSVDQLQGPVATPPPNTSYSINRAR